MGDDGSVGNTLCLGRVLGCVGGPQGLERSGEWVVRLVLDAFHLEGAVPLFMGYIPPPYLDTVPAGLLELRPFEHLIRQGRKGKNPLTDQPGTRGGVITTCTAQYNLLQNLFGQACASTGKWESGL